MEFRFLTENVAFGYCTILRPTPKLHNVGKAERSVTVLTSPVDYRSEKLTTFYKTTIYIDFSLYFLRSQTLPFFPPFVLCTFYSHADNPTCTSENKVSVEKVATTLRGLIRCAILIVSTFDGYTGESV